MSDFILYNYFRSSTSYRVRIALNLKNISYEYKSVHLLKNGGEQHMPEYRELNPQGEVPTLIHQGRALGQSMAILEYLDDIEKLPLLFPKDPYQKGLVRQFCENINSFLHPLSNLKIMQKLEKDHGFDPAQKSAWIQHWYQIGFTALEKTLQNSSSKFCFGNSITAADIFLIPAIFSAKRFEVDLASYAKCLEVNAACLEIPAFKAAHPYRQIDTPDAEKII